MKTSTKLPSESKRLLRYYHHKAITDIKSGNEQGKPRSQLISELKKDISRAYDYNTDLVDLVFDLFAPDQAIEFIESNEVARPLTIRTNTLKTKRRDLARILMQKGVHLEPVGSWTKVGLTIFNSNVPIGATTEYLAGFYMLQAASSLLPVMALDPQENEKVLDMAAAPGGKTTYIAQLMKNTGVLIANDSNKERCKALIANMQRLGVSNSVVVNYDGRKIPKSMSNFDRVLLDAPCSGTGVISKDPSVKTERKAKDILRNSHIQKELILAAIDALNPHSATGGILVYSTCSISVEENEMVVQYALNHRYMKIVETGVEIGENGMTGFKGKPFDSSMKLCRRIYPHTHNMDGFFFAKLKKIANGVKLSNSEKKDQEYKEKKELKEKKREETKKDDSSKKASKEEHTGKKHKGKRKQADGLNEERENQGNEIEVKKTKKKKIEKEVKEVKEECEDEEGEQV